MFRHTSSTLFYKNDRTRRFTNPMRRWFYHYLTAGAIAASGLYVTAQYQMAKYEARSDPGGDWALCSSTMLDLMYLAPLNLISNTFGKLTETPYVSNEWHQAFVQWLIKHYQVDMSDCSTEEFNTAQDFFVRSWRDGARPVDSVAPIVSPCDCEVLAVEENVKNDRIIQVKGVKHSLAQIMQGPLAPVKEGYKRVAISLHLRTQDYHHVISPCAFRCSEATYIPGYLLPTTAAGFHWVAGLFKVNERIVLSGSFESDPKAEVRMALIGSTLVGRIKLHFDKRFVTNNLDPPAYALHRRYSSSPLIKKGAEVATFMWGSAVLIVADVPHNAALSCAVGDILKAGQAVVAVKSSQK